MKNSYEVDDKDVFKQKYYLLSPKILLFLS